MPSDLPTTAIGLIAFIVAGAGYALWKIVSTFMTYIEKKNNNLERTSEHFTITLAERDRKFDDMLLKHDERHKEMLDDMAARLDATFSKPKRKK